MRKRLIVLFLALSCFLTVIMVCSTRASRIRKVLPGEILDGQVLQENIHILLDYDGDERDTLRTTLIPSEELMNADIHLLISVIRSFDLFINGELAYHFEGTPAVQLTHDIPIGNEITCKAPLEIVIKAGSKEVMTNSVRCLIGDGSSIQKNMNTAYALTLILAGMYVAIIINCLSLFLRKRTESYLLYMMLFTISVACTGILYSNLPIPNFPLRNVLHMGYLHAASEIFSLMLYVKLFRISILDRFGRWYPIWLLGASFVALFVINRFFSPLRIFFLELFFFCSLIIIVVSFFKGRLYANLILVGSAASWGLNIYDNCVNYGLAQPTLLMYYCHMPAVYYLIQAFFCMIIVNAIFSQKFKEAETLFFEVEQANQKLDEKVKQRTIELEKANSQLIQEQQEKHAMMTNLFHDLRSPVFCALGYTDIIKEKYPESSRETTVLKRQLEHLSHLTEELFLMAKLEEKQITFALQPVDMYRMCMVLIEELKPEIDANGKDISLAGETALVTGDGFRLRQAVENILMNAIIHTPRGTAIRIWVKRERDQVLVIIDDNGPGIPANSKAHLFDRYYTFSQGKKGSGLGLPIALEIVRAHNGSIDVESELDKGSRFTIYLPARYEDHS